MPLHNLEEVMLNLCFENSNSVDSRFSSNIIKGESGLVSNSGGLTTSFRPVAVPQTVKNLIQPYSCLLKLSTLHPRLKTLDVSLSVNGSSSDDKNSHHSDEDDDEDDVFKELHIASSRLFANTFPHLRHLTLRMQDYEASSLASFLLRHPDLRSFVCHNGLCADLIFTDDTLPNVTRLGGNMGIISKICHGWRNPRPNVLALRGDENGSGPRPMECLIEQLLPKLPGLIDLYVATSSISPEWLAGVGKACPGLKYLEIEAKWNGLLVR